MQDKSFYEATARERARLLIDDDTYRELAGPERTITSPHLPELGEAVSFDDGVVTAAGRIGGRPVFVISQEGRFIGGSVGEVGGAKMVGTFAAALALYEKARVKFPDDESCTPAVIISFETGGVRLHEANAGLLAHAEIMEQIQACRGKLPVISLIGSRVGCFGGMGFVAVSTDVLIMSELGRVGLTGPEVIEEVMGKKEFDASDRALIYRTTGGKHRYIMGDCAYLVEDSIQAFRAKLLEILSMSLEQISEKRCIGSNDLVARGLERAQLAASLRPNDSHDVWAHFGNVNADKIPDMYCNEFLQNVRTAKGGGA